MLARPDAGVLCVLSAQLDGDKVTDVSKGPSGRRRALGNADVTRHEKKKEIVDTKDTTACEARAMKLLRPLKTRPNGLTPARREALGCASPAQPAPPTFPRRLVTRGC